MYNLGQLIGLVMYGAIIYFFVICPIKDKKAKKEAEKRRIELEQAEAKRRETEPWPKLDDHNLANEVKTIYPQAQVYNNPEAQFRMWKIFKGIDWGYAFDYLKRAAEQRYEKALIEGYHEIENTINSLIGGADERTWEVLVEWGTMLAEAGYEDYQCELANIYSEHYKDMRRAFYWHSKAAEKGVVESLVAVGKMYHAGTYVNRDWNKAIFYLKPAANAGDREAARILEEIEMDMQMMSK